MRFFIYVGALFLEVLLLYLFIIFIDQYKINKYKQEMRLNALRMLDYSLSKEYLKPTIMSIRDYIDLSNKDLKSLEELRKRKEKIVEVLRNNFLTSDAFYLSAALIDEQNRPFYLKNAKLSNDIYISNIASVYYYTLVSKEISEAIGSSFQEWLKNVPSSYKWIIDLIKNPTFSFAKNYMVNKLKEVAKVSTDPILTAVSIGLLISLDYKDEQFYNSFLGSSYPVVFVISSVGLYSTAKTGVLKDYQKYSYFVFNKPDLYRYYSMLLIMKYTSVYPDIYLNILDFDVLRDYKEAAICIVSVIYE